MALTDEALAATLRWISRNWVKLDLAITATRRWVWDFPLGKDNGGYIWTQAADDLPECVQKIHTERLTSLEFFQ